MGLLCHAHRRCQPLLGCKLRFSFTQPTGGRFLHGSFIGSIDSSLCVPHVRARLCSYVDASQIFSNLVRKDIEGFVQYVEAKPEVVKNLIGAYGNTDIALHGGAMLRECIRYENVARLTLYDETLWLFFDQVACPRRQGREGGSVLVNCEFRGIQHWTTALDRCLSLRRRRAR